MNKELLKTLILFILDHAEQMKNEAGNYKTMEDMLQDFLQEKQDNHELRGFEPELLAFVNEIIKK